MQVKTLQVALAVLLFTACSTAAGFQLASTFGEISSPTLTVFAAASLTEAFTEIGQRFEVENPGVNVVFNFAGSQQLAGQLAQGAPSDVFASADWKQIQSAIDANRLAAPQAYKFAGNRLVVVFPAHNPAHLIRLQDLAKPGLRLALADAAVPAGNYARQFLEKARKDPEFGPAFVDGVGANVVTYEENVRAVLSKVILGEVDAGIVYTSDLDSSNPDILGKLDISDDLNVESEYYIAVLKDSLGVDLARAFITFVLSPSGQDILEQHGFLPIVPLP